VVVDLLAALSGLGFGLSLIVAIGAQNAFVLRQGIRGEHIAVVVAICAVSDAVLITLGVAGAGAVIEGMPELADGVRIAGAAFLFGYAALAARRVWRPSALHASGEDAAGVRRARRSRTGTRRRRSGRRRRARACPRSRRPRRPRRA